MKRLLFSLGLLLALSAGAQAQVSCVGVGGVNNVPQVGIVCPQEPSINTFGTATIGLVTPSSASDVVCLNGSATKVIRLQRVYVSGTAATAVVVPVAIAIHSALDTGGTSTLATITPMDSNNTATTATVSAYTANPTVTSTTSGNIAIANLAVTTTSTLTGTQPATIFDWEGRTFDEAPIARGATQQICVNFQSTTISTPSINVGLKWTEAPQ